MGAMAPLSIVVMGTGGVGGYFGARLALSGARVTFVARGPNLDALQARGLTVHSALHGRLAVRVDAVQSLVGRPPADAVLFCVKSFDTESAAAALRPVVGPDTAVLSLQNGVDNVEKIDAVLGAGHALGGAAYVFAVREAPGVVVHRAGGRIVFGELDGRRTPRAERLRETLAGAGVPVELSADIRRVLWEKYLFIGAQAGLTALTRCSIGVVRAVPETWRLYRRVLEELAAVGRAAGVALAPEVVERILKEAESLPAEARSSLASDLAQGHRLELEALHGHALRLGERLGVSTPALDVIYAALKPFVDGPPESPR
jgi:2-dehydropantoate 2-reductase